jgi:hypothetical protein
MCFYLSGMYVINLKSFGASHSNVLVIQDQMLGPTRRGNAGGPWLWLLPVSPWPAERANKARIVVNGRRRFTQRIRISMPVASGALVSRSARAVEFGCTQVRPTGSLLATSSGMCCLALVKAARTASSGLIIRQASGLGW